MQSLRTAFPACVGVTILDLIPQIWKNSGWEAPSHPWRGVGGEDVSSLGEMYLNGYESSTFMQIANHHHPSSGPNSPFSTFWVRPFFWRGLSFSSVFYGRRRSLVSHDLVLADLLLCCHPSNLMKTVFPRADCA